MVAPRFEVKQDGLIAFIAPLRYEADKWDREVRDYFPKVSAAPFLVSVRVAVARRHIRTDFGFRGRCRTGIGSILFAYRSTGCDAGSMRLRSQ